MWQPRRPVLLALGLAITALAVLAGAFSLAVPRTGSAQTAGASISGSIPSQGFGLVVFSGGTNEQLLAASGCPRATAAFWVTSANGGFIAFVPASTVAIVNAEWLAAFPNGIPANTPLIARCREATTAPATATATATASSTATAGAIIDRTRLPLGDGKVASREQQGAIYACQTQFNGGGAFRDGPWIKADGTFDITAKAIVDGAVAWPHSYSATVQGDRRVITGNGLPAHTTGTYPIAPSDDAYQYDRNPNSIQAQQLSYTLPRTPVLATRSTCLPMGAIGITTNGVVFFNALDAAGRDAVAHEVLDGCEGHPERTGVYHYHSASPCLPDAGAGHSPLIGYAFDGFGIYGARGEGGVSLGTADLDACHGHTHLVEWDGALVTMYHYHATPDYPYTLACYRGTPQVQTRTP